MFWYVMLMLFSPIYLMFGLVFRTEQARLRMSSPRETALRALWGTDEFLDTTGCTSILGAR